MPVVTTSTIPTATAYPNQRKVDRCQNGVLWAVVLTSGGSTTLGVTHYSTNNGATWTTSTVIPNGSGGTSLSYERDLSLFIDVDDYAHVVFKDNHDGRLYYRRGTPNVGRTAWTWSAPLEIGGVSTSRFFGDIVAHKEGTGWRAHVVATTYGVAFNFTTYMRVDITSGGVITLGVGATTIGGDYGLTVPTYPSIDFNHNGDGKTVAGAPHLYSSWTSGSSGGGRGLRFKRAAYAGGTWTWGPEREIDPDRRTDGWFRMSTCLFDGTRVIIGGLLISGASSQDLMLYERDAADTATTTRVLQAAVPEASKVFSGNMTYDGEGNVYFVGSDNDGTYNIGYRKWTRATTTLGAWTLLGGSVTGSGSHYGHSTVKRGTSGGLMEGIYTNNVANPYDVVEWSIAAPETVGAATSGFTGFGIPMGIS